MEVYTVGGAVRDELLGLPVQDRDYVVVGSTPQELVALGYRPVGQDFPVFLHPQTHEEYALARTERKTTKGYHGFSFHAAPDVTLEQDLARRDLTINAMAKDAAGRLIDPFHGADDLHAHVLRHVSPAFAEDPVRVLRVARFAARLDFYIAEETRRLMQDMVQSGEVDALVPERVWQELSRGLMERQPSRMFHALMDCGALARIAPALARALGADVPAEIMRELDEAAEAGACLRVRFAILTQGLTGTETAALCDALRVPSDCRDVAALAGRLRPVLRRANQLSAAELLRVFDEADAWRKPQRFQQIAAAALGSAVDAAIQRTALSRALDAAARVSGGAIARQTPDPAEIRKRLHEERLAAIERALTDNFPPY